MTDRELDALLRETLGAEERPPTAADARVRRALDMRRDRKGISLWWAPLACSFVMGAVLCLVGGLLPWPLEFLCRTAALGGAAATAVLTAVGLLRFDLREKGMVLYE